MGVDDLDVSGIRKGKKKNFFHSSFSFSEIVLSGKASRQIAHLSIDMKTGRTRTMDHTTASRHAHTIKSCQCILNFILFLPHLGPIRRCCCYPSPTAADCLHELNVSISDLRLWSSTLRTGSPAASICRHRYAPVGRSQLKVWKQDSRRFIKYSLYYQPMTLRFQ